jgi:hypothetical protein
VAPEGTPTHEVLEEEQYAAIGEMYPGISHQELEQAKSHPQGHLEGIVQAIRARTGEAADAIRERLRRLLHRG